MDHASRREFIQQTATLAGGVVAGGVASGSAAAQAQAPASASGPRPLSKGAKLRALLQKPSVTVAPEAFSVFTARLAEINGFEAIYIGGNMMSGMHLGVEDWGLINPAEMAEIAARIANEISIPAVVDADQAGETALNTYRTVKAYERAGLAAMHIEDTINPKHMGGAANRLQPLDEIVTRISAAVDGRTDPDFVIIGRSDCMSTDPYRGNLDEAIRRGVAMAKAGADAYFCLGVPSDQVDRLANNVPIPLVMINKPLKEVRNSKLKLNMWAGHVYPVAAKMYETMVQELKEHGEFIKLDERRPSAETMAKVMNAAEYRTIADKWAKVRV